MTDMREMFDMLGNEEASSNQDISSWDVSSVTDMRGMFMGNSFFDQPIEDWDVSSVTNMYGMFLYAESFNQPIGDWDVSNVTTMRFMLKDAEAFNQNLSSWEVSSVTDCLLFSENTPQWTLPKPNFTNCTP